MSQCYGKTKSGDRCKRSTREGSRFCTIHADQAQDEGDPGPRADVSMERQPLEAVGALAAAGLVLAAVLAARRLFRLL